jgi:hypothetical protein
VDKKKRFSFGHGHANPARGDAVAAENCECVITQVGRNSHQ